MRRLTPTVWCAPVRRAIAHLAVLIAAVALAGCGGKSDSATTKSLATTPSTPATPVTPPTTTTTTTGSAPAPATCQRVARPKARPDGGQSRPKGMLDATKRWTVTMTTSCGELAFTLDVKRAPKTTASFAGLVRRGFFDGLTFQRIAAGFVIQGGDPTGTGQGGPGYSVVEAPPKDAQYTLGTVAMAKTEIEDPGTSGSQFFIVTAPDTGLPPDYAIVGKISSGLDTVKRIAAVDADPSTQQPLSPVVIARATLRSSAGG